MKVRKDGGIMFELASADIKDRQAHMATPEGDVQGKAKTKVKTQKLGGYEYLRLILVNTITLMMKTQAYYWSVALESGIEVRSLLGQQYTELFKASDLLLERVKRLGLKFNYSLPELRALNRMMEPEISKEEKEKLGELKEDNNWIFRIIKRALNQFAAENDKVTARVLLQRLNAHERAGKELAGL